MTDSSSLSWMLTRGSGPLVLVHAYDEAEREEMRRLLDVSAPSGTAALEAADLDTALRETGKLVFLSPDDEPGALRELERRRDELEVRTAPLVVFILRGGEASKTLGDLPWLASFIRGHEIDPRAADGMDARQARTEFEAKTGLSPAAYLAKYRAGAFPDDEAANALAAEAALLEDGA